MSLPKRLKAAWKKFQEKPDPTPHSLAVPLKRPLTLQEEITRVLQFQKQVEALNIPGVETFEESNDFDIPDEPEDPLTRWEEDYYGKFEEDVAMERALYEEDPKEKGLRVRRAPRGKKQASQSDRNDLQRSDNQPSARQNDVRSEKNDLQTVSAGSGKQQPTVQST